jgi:PPK2 family polyphosphate:nucleotide phosphotransferase
LAAVRSVPRAKDPIVFEAVDSPWLVPFDGAFRLGASPTSPPAEAPGKRDSRERLAAASKMIDELQPALYAENRRALLLIFQALDAAGKDGTIRAVLEGVNPAGCQVHSFKAPSDEELDHDFLWRTAMRLPERGRIGVFNRSYYEEVLVVRVHPEFLERQRLPDADDELWEERFESIRDHEQHLARNGTVILKFFLNVSKEEQRQRFLSRLDEPEKHWKFSERDVAERGHWDAYMHAYDHVLRATSRSWAPWYAVPADSKPFMRMAVAETIAAAMQSMDLRYPTIDAEALARFHHMREHLSSGQ